MKLPDWLLTMLLLGFILLASARAQTDTSLNNLVHPPGYRTSDWGSLFFEKKGSGERALIVLPGWGFDGSVFQSFIEKELAEYTVYLVTLPGYGGTQAYPMPPGGTSYGECTWMRGVEMGVLQMLEKEHLESAVLVAHFAVSSYIAMELAAEHPGKFGKVVLIGSPAAFTMPPPNDTIGYQGRLRGVDNYLAPRWFKTVSTDTWLKGNFPPQVYSLDSLRGRDLFGQANTAPLPVQIRYLCEFWAADYVVYKKAEAPVLVIIPSFTPALMENKAYFFLEGFTKAWEKVEVQNSNITLAKVEGSGCNVMQDQPGELKRLLVDFLK